MSMRASLAAVAVVVGAVFVVGCSQMGQSTSPTTPTSTSSVASASLGSGTLSERALVATHGEQLTAVLGTGTGIVNVTPTAAVDGSFSAQISVNVHDAPPNTTFYVQRAPEVGRPNGADGICQRAAGLPPWGAPTPNFVTFPLPAAGPLVTLQTSNGGAGAVHIDFAAPTISDGTQFDVMFRLVDNLTSPTNELRTGCFTVTVK
jgi:hypothetical protein